MKRIVLALFILLALAVMTGPSLFAEGTPYWIHSYSERTQPPCLFMVAQWSDGSYTNTPISCDQDHVAWYNRIVDRVFSEADKNGCVWYVTQWQDGSYTKVPVSCPSGKKAYKPADMSVFFSADGPTSIFLFGVPQAPMANVIITGRVRREIPVAREPCQPPVPEC